MSRLLRPPAPALLLALGLALLGAGSILIAASSGRQDPRPSRLDSGRAVNAGSGDLSDISAHNSPTIVQNPRDPRQLVVANRIDSPLYDCALHVSADGGTTWSERDLATPGGRARKCYAPDAAFDAKGTLHVSFVTLRGRGNVPAAGWLVSSADGGRTFSSQRKVLGPLSFQVRITADPVDPDRLFLTWVKASDVGLYRFASVDNPVMFRRSGDGGATWSAPSRVSEPAGRRVVAPSLAVGAGGRLVVLFLDLGEDRLDYEGLHEGRGGAPYAGPWRLALARSGDSGRTWRNSTIEARLVPTERFVAFVPPFPSLAVDRGDGRLYASFQDGRLGDADVSLWTSADEGDTWTKPLRVNDTRPRDGTSQYLPKLSIAPDGRLDIVYYDRRRDADNVFNEVSLQSSFDAGRTFSRRLVLSPRASDSRIGFGGERDLADLGSRLALLSTRAGALAVWTDTGAGTTDSKKQDLVSALVSFSRPAGVSEGVEALLRYGGLVLLLAGLAVAFLAARARTGRAH